MDSIAKEWADSVSIIPIEPKGKKPLLPWKEFTERMAPRAERAEWRKRWPGCNWGLVTGSISGYIVLDFDKDEGRALFNEHKVAGTCAVNITANGFHALFAVEAEPIGNATGIVPGLDVRGENGYIIIPPSTHPSGKKYQWQVPPWMLRPAPALPEWFWPLWESKKKADAAVIAAERPTLCAVTIGTSTFTDFAQGHGCVMPAGGWVADGRIHRCDAIAPDGTLGRDDGSYKVHRDHPVIGFIQNHHRHQQLLSQQWRPAR